MTTTHRAREYKPQNRTRRAAAIAEARRLGLHPTEGTPRTIQLDLDTDAAYARAERMLDAPERYGLPRVYGVDWRSSRNGNTHALVRLAEPMPLSQRILWAAILGSDADREAANLAEAAAYESEPLLFLTAPWGAAADFQD